MLSRHGPCRKPGRAGEADKEQGIPAYRSSDSRARGILEAHDFSLSPSAPDHLSPEYSLIKPGTIMGKIHVLDNEISICTLNNEDYICITDIARYKDPDRTKLSYPELAAEQEYH
jgi:hypothetical protein